MFYAATGKFIYRCKTGSDVMSPLMVVSGVVYIGSVGDHVYALRSPAVEGDW